MGGGEPAPQEFTRKWSDVIREWSPRYGRRVSGWWFDGAYNTGGWEDQPRVQEKVAFRRLTDEQDYTAGEQENRGATPQQDPAPADVQWTTLSSGDGFSGNLRV